MKKYSIIYFSPTGNTKYLAKCLSSKIEDCQVYNMQTTDVDEIEGDEIIIMSSIRAFSVSMIVTKYLDLLLSRKKIKKIHIINVGCTTASINDGSSILIYRVAKKHSVLIGIDRVLAMPLTIAYKFPKEVGKKQIQDSVDELESISDDIKSGIEEKRIIKTSTKALGLINVIERNAAKLFGLELHATKDCIKCSKCINECPTKNITYNKKGKIKVSTKCMLCLNCIYTCPKKAMTPRISKFIPLKGYSLKEYLD